LRYSLRTSSTRPRVRHDADNIGGPVQPAWTSHRTYRRPYRLGTTDRAASSVGYRPSREDARVHALELRTCQEDHLGKNRPRTRPVCPLLLEAHRPTAPNTRRTNRSTGYLFRK